MPVIKSFVHQGMVTIHQNKFCLLWVFISHLDKMI